MVDKPADTPSPATHILLVRHGRTVYNHERRFLGTTDIGLDEAGHREAAALPETLTGQFDRLASSPLARAMETAAYLGEIERTLPGIRELEQGDLEGLTFDEALSEHAAYFERWAADPSTARVPGGGESLGDLRARAVPAVLELAREGGRWAVVTHQLVIATLSCVAAGVPLSNYREWTVPNTGTRALVVRGGRLELAHPPDSV